MKTSPVIAMGAAFAVMASAAAADEPQKNTPLTVTTTQPEWSVVDENIITLDPKAQKASNVDVAITPRDKNMVSYGLSHKLSTAQGNLSIAPQSLPSRHPEMFNDSASMGDKPKIEISIGIRDGSWLRQNGDNYAADINDIPFLRDVPGLVRGGLFEGGELRYDDNISVLTLSARINGDWQAQLGLAAELGKGADDRNDHMPYGVERPDREIGGIARLVKEF